VLLHVADLRRQLRLVREEAELVGTAPVIEALVQTVTLTTDRAVSIQEIADRIPGASAADIASTPFLLIGSYEQMADQLLAQADGDGITSYVVREPAVPHIERVLALLAR
jgi:alkanesulfonate monooxygenase SsuD/methylene tetrahydromethanopterin reductase-like flavin-dependent oxidoreductase (luciferase family)